MLETGVHATIGEIAAAERIRPSYASSTKYAHPAPWALLQEAATASDHLS